MRALLTLLASALLLTTAQAQQLPASVAYPAQYNSVLPTFASGKPALLQTDVNGRLILSPSSTLMVANFPAIQPVSNAGAFPVQNTAPVVGGNTAPVKTDGSATTQPVSNPALASLDVKTPALGPQTKAASRSTTPASDLTNIEPGGTPISGSVMPAGGTGLTGWLSAIWQGIVGRQSYLVASSSNLAAGGYLNESNYVYLGASPSPYTYLNASFYSNQAGTYTVQATDGTNVYVLASGTLPASTLTPVRLPAAAVTATGTRYRAFIQNGSATAILAFASISLTAN